MFASSGLCRFVLVCDAQNRPMTFRAVRLGTTSALPQRGRCWRGAGEGSTGRYVTVTQL